ncbi:MAG: hypothetical protein HZA50_05890 [Planctomycetes bacterium]|nr:hypothetical protein [Planctomycetota bacterium]
MGLPIIVSAGFVSSILVWAALPAAGQDKPTDVSSRHFKTEIVSASAEGIVVRGAFEITGPAHRWYEVRFQVLLSADKTLEFSDGRPMVLSWGNVFTPRNIASPQWTDCQFKVPAAYLNASTNLPKSARTVLFVTCELWDFAAQKYLGAGWNARAAAIVTTDAAGKVVKIDQFNTDQTVLLPSHPTESMEVRECRLDLKNLKLKPDAAAYRAVGVDAVAYDLLLSGELRCDIRGNSRGYFFQPADTAEKAGELAAMGYGGAVVIKTAEQFKSIVGALKAIGYRPGVEILQENPPALGFETLAEPQLGWRIKMLTIDKTPAGGFGNIVYRELCIGLDSTIGVRAMVCVKARDEGSAERLTPAAATTMTNYTTAILIALTQTGSQSLPQPVAVTNTKRTIACQAAASSKLFLKVADWPAWAGPSAENAPTSGPAADGRTPLETAPAASQSK